MFKFSGLHFIFFILLTFLSCSSSTTTPTEKNVLPASALYPFGRTATNVDKHIELISSASHIGFSFTGTDCEVFCYIPDPNGHNYIQYELDGKYQARLKIIGNSSRPIRITATTNGTHTVWLYKATEAHTGPIFIEKITGYGLEALKRTDAPLIEFIGNSITCGAAADSSQVSCGAGEYHDQHNAYMAYGPRVARALRSNFIISGVSGIGIYRNWNSDGPAMPLVYQKADFQHDSERLWKFDQYQPDIVSIALGTNDFSNGDGKRERLPFDSTAFVNMYTSFVKIVKAKYPEAQIVLLSSPMINGARRIKLQSCLTAVKTNIDTEFSSGSRVAVFFFKPMEARGCTGHPNVDDHALLAEQVTPFFKGLL
jgi:lysophospholipase L1-like esterase